MTGNGISILNTFGGCEESLVATFGGVSPFRSEFAAAIEDALEDGMKRTAVALPFIWRGADVPIEEHSKFPRRSTS
ncbi:hypothetical protein QM646_16000 [Rhodococcus erythropolis]|nr:hypothetical protein [Rhodococcus erythropolis]